MLDIRHKIWAMGYEAGSKDRRAIKTVIKTQGGMVLVFDDSGEQIPEYQGQYAEVKPRILKDAPPSTVFIYIPNDENNLKIVPREEW